MDHARASQVFFVGGILLLGFSFLWPQLVGGTNAYSDEDARAYQKAAADLHDALHRTTHENDSHHHSRETEHNDEPPSLQTAQQRFDEVQAKRDEALIKGQTTSKVTRWLSIAVLAIGGVFRFFQARQSG